LRIKNNPYKEGLLIMNLQCSGGAANDGVIFTLKAWVEIYSIYAHSSGYICFPDTMGAALNNSIFEGVQVIGGSAPGVNISWNRFLTTTGTFMWFPRPIITRKIEVHQSTISASVFSVFYRNFNPV